ncbi:hypothetical protein A6F68_01620 [Tsuneonella dongtanensis]|uniref:DUF3089 domain-containing protein n=1 Tax=Tsuneonella dongtanensis TaxID=692370 RepID=A0A1B2ADA4_9SPHN|nr:DUF3089 domain-containing protein [Tsuneonella dongtanensis]ANY20133.1 hypothetical protein A6F68_01620 [Tsuneonella dongtanensis]
MARKFLYFVAFCIVVVIAGAFALAIWSQQLTRLAFVPSAEFVEQSPLAANAYQDPAMWLSRPGMGVNDPARWQPAFEDENDRSLLPTPADPEEEKPREFAVFFVHPTSFLDRNRWNAPLDDAEANRIARIYARGMASPFNQSSEIWAPKYRQATFGAFLAESPEATKAIDAAYRDVRDAFRVFLASVDPDDPIVLAGHSQGSLHLLRLLREEVAGKPLATRVAAVYAVGWPISLEHDLPALGLPACATAEQAGCVMSWSTFAEPADPGPLLESYSESKGFDGQLRGDSAFLCSNPLTGGIGGSADAGANLGALVPNGDLSHGSLIRGYAPARCDDRGLLLIGAPPEMGDAVLPGNNYHVYDIPLFWANLREDVRRRVSAWTPPR